MKLVRWMGVVGVLILTLAVRAAWLAIFPVDPIAPVDAEGFHLLAVNVLAGRGFAIGWEPPYCPTTVRTPLYPLFLMGSYAIMGAEPARAVLLQLLLEVITTALVIRLGSDLGGRRIGMLAGLLYALNGSTQRYTGYLLSEVLLLPLLAAALLTTTRYFRRRSVPRAALAGLLWGLSLLTKPNVQFLALAVGGLLAWRQIANQKLEIRNYESRITNHKLQIGNRKSKIENRKSRSPFSSSLSSPCFPRGSSATASCLAAGYSPQLSMKTWRG